MAIGQVLASEPLRNRPVFLAELGVFFKELRVSHGWSLRGTASIAQRKKLNPPLTYQVLFRLERGETKNPEPEVLRALAGLYNLTYEALAGRFIEQRYGLNRDLLRHGRTGQRTPHQQGESDVPASARIQQLERRVQDYEAALREVQDVASRLARIAAVGEEGRATDRAPTRVRGRDRKTG